MEGVTKALDKAMQSMDLEKVCSFTGLNWWITVFSVSASLTQEFQRSIHLLGKWNEIIHGSVCPILLKYMW